MMRREARVTFNPAVTDPETLMVALKKKTRYQEIFIKQ